MKKAVSLILALFMIVTLLPIATIFASADEPYSQKWDFTTLASHNGAPAEGATSSNITGRLPAGWIATDDTDGADWWTSVNYDKVNGDTGEGPYGIRLGGADQGIAMTDAAGVPEAIRNATVDYAIQVKWNTNHKFALIRWGWQTSVPTASTIKVDTHVAYNYTGGPSNHGAFSDGTDRGGNFMFANTYSTVRQDLEENTLTHQNIVDLHSVGATSGHQVTTTFEISGGKLVAVYNTIDGETVKYLPPADYTAITGYFSCWITNWGANNTACIQSVEIREGTALIPRLPYHYSADFTTLTPNNGVPTEGATSSNITSSLPTGWIATDDADGTWWTAVNYEKVDGVDTQVNNGVRLGGAAQGIAMTDAAGVPDYILNGTVPYTITVKYNTTHKFDRVRWRFSTAVPTTSTIIEVAPYGEFRYAGGPASGNAFKNGSSDAYNFLFSNNPSVAADLKNLATDATLDNAGVSALIGAGMAAGHQVKNTYEIVDGKLIALYVTVDGETLVMTPTSEVDAKGYFCIWQNGWGTNNTMSIQSVDIQEGVFDPQTLIPDEEYDPDDPSSAFNYYIDFTKLSPDAGTDGTINDTLPDEWVAKRDSDLKTQMDDAKTKFPNITTAINYETDKATEGDIQVNNGVRLGGDGQGIAMTDAANVPNRILKAESDYTITVKWNTMYKFAWIRFGWSGKDSEGKIAVPTQTTIAAGKQVGYNYTGGPWNKGGPQEAFGDGEGKGGNVQFAGAYSAEILDEYGRALSFENLKALHADGVKNGRQVTTTFEIAGGKLVAVYMTIDGITVKYLPTSEFVPLGYFSVWITNWGSGNTASIQSVEIREGTYTAPGFPTISGVTPVSAVDFANIKSDEALNAAGYNFYGAKPADSGEYEPKVTYVSNGLALNAAAGEFLVNTGLPINRRGNYILDYTFRVNPTVQSFNAVFGLTAEGISLDTIKAELANKSVLKTNGEGYKFYKDATFAEQLETTPAIVFDSTVPVRVRLLISGGSAEYAFVTVGNEHFYLKLDNALTNLEGLVGFTFADAYNAGNGVILEKCVISACDMGDTSGGDTIVPDLEIDYIDAADTYYKDGYVLHNMDFSKVDDYYDTNYSFASNSAVDRVVKVEEGVLVFQNNDNKAAYLMFTGNAIPKNITEYTANFKFRFVGEENGYFGFIRGISLTEEGARKSSQTIEISYKGKVYDAVAADDAVWAEIATAMQAGEWLEVTVSNINRKVDAVTVKCGEKSVSFVMDKNKAAEAGYMGFVIGASTKVEVASVTILAGIAANATTPIWPEGVTAGDLVQNVTVAAVASGTKPIYDSDNGETTDNSNTEPVSTPATEPATSTEEVPAKKKKGCSSSIVALPVVLVTAIFGCAITFRKKRRLIHI